VENSGWFKQMDSKEPEPVVDGMAWRVNGASTHARQLVAVFQVLCSLYGLTCVATLKTLLNSSHVLLWYTWLAGAFAFTQTGYLLKSVIPTTNALPSWRLNARCTTVADSVLMNSRTQKILWWIVAILLSTDAAARLCVRRAI